VSFLPYLSAIVPLYNERENIGRLSVEIGKALDLLPYETEAIFVDDGSTDGSSEILNSIASCRKGTKIIRLAKNMGKHKALERAFRESRGEIVVTLDGDLQNDPIDIAAIVSRIAEGFDVVCGWRHRRNDPRWKRARSLAANAIQRAVTGLDVHDLGCGLRGYRRHVLDGITLRHRYDIELLPLSIAGTYAVGEVKVGHRRRVNGVSKYPAIRTAIGISAAYFKLLFRKMSSPSS